MKKKADRKEAIERLDTLLGGEGRGGYSVTAAVSDPLKRRLRGRWEVAEHRLSGEPYLARFAARTLKGAELSGAEYRAEYEFREGVCLKRVDIRGVVLSGGESVEYAYRLRVASTWDLEGSSLLSIRPELGYQYTELGGEPAAVLDLERVPDPVEVAFRFEDGSLVLEEGDDYKRLERSGQGPSE